MTSLLSGLLLTSLTACTGGCNGPQQSAPKRALSPPPPAAPHKIAERVPTAPDRPLRLALIGDYGDPNPGADRVAAMVHTWDPDLVLTVGDNNYPVGAKATIDANIGRRYGRYIKPYKGRFGAGAKDRNRFFPSLGNHDWYTTGAWPYLQWFELPGNERYYDVLAGPVHLFFLDSDRNEPDGVTPSSTQGRWLQRGLAAAQTPFRFVLFHHPAYNTGRHRAAAWMRWPFRQWGATLTVAGHDHHYERILQDQLWHVITGHGGRGLYPFANPVAPGSRVRFYGVHGAMRVTVTKAYARFESLTPEGVLLDAFGLPPSHGPDAPKGKARTLLPLGATWQVLPPGHTPQSDWATAPATAKPWQTSKLPAGRGVAGLATTLEEADDGKPQTIHLRTAVKVTKPPRWLLVRARRDDGLRLLVNGAEVWRLNLPLGAIDASTEAGVQVQWAAESAVVETWIPGSVLKPGANAIAVSLHQARGAAHDAIVDLGIDAID